MNRSLKIVLKLVVTVFFLWLVYHKVNLAQIQEQIGQLQLWPLLLFFTILFLNTLIGAVKWRLFLQADGVEIPVSSLFASCLIGSFFNLFMPSTIGGDAYRIFSIKQHNAKFSKSFASVLAERLSGFFALACFGLIFSIIGFKTLPHPLCFLVPLVVFLLISGIAILIMNMPIAVKLMNIFRLNKLPRIGSELEKMLHSFAAYSREPWLIVKILGWSFLFQFLVIECIAILARAINLDIPASAFFIFVPIITLLEALPVSIYGLGLRDFGYVFFLTQMAVVEPEANAATLSLLYVSTTVLYVSLGGLLFLFRLFYSSKSRATLNVPPSES